MCNNGKKIILISADLFLKGSATWDDESKDKVEGIFQSLHSAFFAHGQTDIGLNSSAAIDYETSVKINRKPIYEIANEDKSILHRILHAFTEGKRLDRARTDSVMFQKVINTTWAAAEMMRNLRQKTLSKLQQFVGFHLLSLNASKPLVDMFGQLGIASACTTMRLKEATSSKEKMKEKLGWDPKIHKHDFIMSTYDNAGWRVRGGSVGYKQYVLIQTLKIPKEKLQDLRIYPKDPEKPNDGICK